MMSKKTRVYVVFAVFTMVTAFLAGCGPDADDAQKILRAAPYKTITDSIGLFPGNADLYTQRAVLLSQHNLHELATADYRKAWELSPTEPAALMYVSNLLLVNRPMDAITLLKECIIKYPGNTEFRRRLSEVYAQTGSDMQALEQLDELIAQDSTNFEAWYEKSNVLVRLGDTAEAIGALERSYRLSPVNYIGLALANLYASVLDPKALTICDQLISRDSTHSIPEPFYVKGTYYSDTRQYPLALQQFDECIKRDWKYTDAYIEKGIVLFEEKEYDKALETFTTATTVTRTSADAWYWMGRCYEVKGDKDKAIENYRKALTFDKNLTEARQRINELKQ